MTITLDHVVRQELFRSDSYVRETMAWVAFHPDAPLRLFEVAIRDDFVYDVQRTFRRLQRVRTL